MRRVFTGWILLIISLTAVTLCAQDTYSKKVKFAIELREKIAHPRIPEGTPFRSLPRESMIRAEAFGYVSYFTRVNYLPFGIPLNELLDTQKVKTLTFHEYSICLLYTSDAADE